MPQGLWPCPPDPPSSPRFTFFRAGLAQQLLPASIFPEEASVSSQSQRTSSVLLQLLLIAKARCLLNIFKHHQIHKRQRSSPCPLF